MVIEPQYNTMLAPENNYDMQNQSADAEFDNTINTWLATSDTDNGNLCNIENNNILNEYGLLYHALDQQKKSHLKKNKVNQNNKSQLKTMLTMFLGINKNQDHTARLKSLLASIIVVRQNRLDYIQQTLTKRRLRDAQRGVSGSSSRMRSGRSHRRRRR